jgi:hypothetical protein
MTAIHSGGLTVTGTPLRSRTRPGPPSRSPPAAGPGLRTGQHGIHRRIRIVLPDGEVKEAVARLGAAAARDGNYRG